MRYKTEEERRTAERQRRREWREKNPEKSRESNIRSSRKTNLKPERKEYVRQYQLQRYNADIEAGRERQREIYRRRRERDPEGATREYFRRSMKNRHGIMAEKYDEIFSGQDFKCAICRTDDPGDRRGWQLDHCHASGKIRGILCRHCNLMLGYAKDRTEVLAAAFEYIKTSQSDDFIGFGISKWKPSPSSLKKSSRPLKISASAAKPKCADDLFSI